MLLNELRRTKNKSLNIINDKKLTCGLDREFNFECIYEENTCQEVIFENSIKNNIENAIKGYNFCIFAYGQTVH